VAVLLRWVSLFLSTFVRHWSWHSWQIWSGRSCNTWNRRIGHWLEISDTDKLPEGLLDCCPSLPGRLTAEYRRVGTCVCVFVCVCLFFSWCYTVITITLWGVDLILGFDLSGHVPGSSTSQTGNVLWWNDHLLMSNLCKIVLSAF